MHPHKNAERTAYYRRQASACSAAASATVIAEVKEAYLNLEQGWLSLAPKAEASRNDLLDPQIDSGDSKPSRART
jgi:hypothetical protein